jgi:uncharacterized protein YaiI (UPF0178 family)
MTRRIMNRLRNHPEIKVSLVVGLFLMVPAWTEAAKISSSDTTHSLREEARASSAPLSISAMIDILHAGTPVSETSTTTYSDGTTQIADLVIVPNTSTGTVTTTKDIKLADGELKKVVDVATISGSTTTQTVTTTLPDGSIQTKNETDVTKGDKTIIKGTVSMPGGRNRTIAGQTIQSGSQSVTSLTITNPAGHVHHDRITITQNGQLSQTETNTTQGPGGSIRTVRSTTNTVLNPSGAGQNDAAPLTIPPPQTAAQVLKLEAQALGSQTGTSGAGTTPLPSPIPEPSGLIVFGVLLGAAGLRRGLRSRSERHKCSRVEL